MSTDKISNYTDHITSIADKIERAIKQNNQSSFEYSVKGYFFN